MEVRICNILYYIIIFMYVHAVWLCCGHEASACTHTHNIDISYSSQSHTYISNIGKLKTDQKDHKHNREAQREGMEV